MAAGLGFKDFATGEVLTAADVDGYLMQGVWVFASATARDAAVTSPQEGNFAYLKDTNVTTYYTGSAWANLDTTGMTNPMTTTGDTIYSSSGSTPARLGIGSTGQVLTVAGGVPSWATPSSSSALNFITGASFSAASTINVNNCFTSTYANYRIIINADQVSVGGTMTMRMRASASDTTTGYNTQRYRGDNATYGGFENQDGTGYWYILTLTGSTDVTGGCQLELYSPELARRTIGLSSSASAASSGDHTFDVGNGLALGNTTQYDGFSLFMTAGNMNGEYRVYGYSNS
jgi:hypothetical protein